VPAHIFIARSISRRQTLGCLEGGVCCVEVSAASQRARSVVKHLIGRVSHVLRQQDTPGERLSNTAYERLCRSAFSTSSSVLLTCMPFCPFPEPCSGEKRFHLHVLRYAA